MSNKFRSFGITLRTRVGINSGLKDSFDTWIKKQDFGAYVYEKEDTDEHIHAQVWTTEPRTRGNIKKPCDAMIRKNFDPDDYKLSIAACVRIAYNDEFIEEYCEKENSLIYKKLPKDEDRYKYYPSEEEQDLAQAKVHSKNLWLRELECLWIQHATTDEKDCINDYNVAAFLGRVCLADLWAIKKDFKLRLQEREILKVWLCKKNSQNLFLTKDQIKIKSDYDQLKETLR
jgi:hypothetical protein